MRIVMSGASGMIGTAVSEHLKSAGDDVIRLVRRPAKTHDERTWDPAKGVLDETVLDGAAACVNFSGAGIGDRPWTRRRIAVIRDSRLQATRTLTAAMRRLGQPSLSFVSQSASGYYGASRQGPLREDSGPGAGVLGSLCVEWEQTARTAPSSVRVVTPRTGVVLSTSGGALGPLLPLLRIGLGGPFGNRRKFWPRRTPRPCLPPQVRSGRCGQCMRPGKRRRQHHRRAARESVPPPSLRTHPPAPPPPFPWPAC